MTMTVPRGALLALCFCVLLSNVPQAESQFDTSMIMGILKSMSTRDKLLFIAQFLMDNPVYYDDLERSLVAALPLLVYDKPPGNFVGKVLPWALNHLPDVLENDVFRGVMKIFIEELNAHNESSDWYLRSGELSADLDFYISHLLSVLDYYGMGVDILQMKSAADYFPYNSTDRQLNEQCYDDTMMFFDRLFQGDTWAFDSMYSSIYQFTHAFYTIANTYGVPLTLSVGLCLPDSCHHDDIEGLLNLGLLGSLFNLTVDQAICTEDQHFKTDDKAHAIIIILGALVLLVIVSSTIELFCLQRRHKQGNIRDLFSPSDLSFNDNNGYVDMPTSGDLKNENDGNDSENVTENNNKISVIQTGDIKTEMKDLSNMKFTRPGKQKKKPVLDISVDSDLTENIIDKSDISDERILSKWMRSFSIFTNIPAILNPETKDDVIPCIYGLRVLTILWIVLGNTYLYVAQSLSEVPVAVDMMDSFDLMQRFTMQAVMAAPFASDTFFVISGCLISYWFLHRCQYQDGKVSIKTWLKFYLGKYWKMTPPYMLIMITFVYLYMYLGDGPIWPKEIAVADSCRTDWWKHLLYISNLIGVDGVEPQNQCMAWSWYIAVNMQFYLISPIILSFTVFSWSMGLAITGIVGVAGIVAAGVKESQYPGEILTSRMDGGEYWNNVFIKPWCRVSTYCVGIALGFVLENWYHKKINKIIATVGWFLAISIGILLVYIPYTKYVEGLEPWTSTQMAVYEALGRPVWAVCVAWVIYACTSGRGGPISDFLSWRGFVPLSRLTYLVYLIHPVLMVLDVYTRRTLVHLNDFEMAYQFIGHVVVNFGAAFFASLAFDMPFRNIKRILHKKPLDDPF
ncbi:uncharacterized protein LOC132737209 [Ruditapes philippinarum]|uniref:uncharacterized protein LOC132737209 n=1 Tax=Ruditapes philippinarum TaxID=129788 RepID=UPI00295B0065|nr:uncharacterized protein LOC132737209 [Ruditapes philippinarum]